MPDGDNTTQGQEPANTTTATTEPNAGSSRSIDSFPEEAQDYIRRLRNEAAGHRNELKDVRAKLQQFEDQNKTEQQKLAERATGAESRLAAAEARALRYEVAAEMGLPLSLAGRLQGTSKEELAADVTALKKELGLEGADAGGAGGSGFDGGVRRPVTRPKTMNGLLRQAAGR